MTKDAKQCDFRNKQNSHIALLRTRALFKHLSLKQGLQGICGTWKCDCAEGSELCNCQTVTVL